MDGPLQVYKKALIGSGSWVTKNATLHGMVLTISDAKKTKTYDMRGCKYVKDLSTLSYDSDPGSFEIEMGNGTKLTLRANDAQTKDQWLVLLRCFDGAASKGFLTYTAPNSPTSLNDSYLGSVSQASTTGSKGANMSATAAAPSVPALTIPHVMKSAILKCLDVLTEYAPKYPRLFAIGSSQQMVYDMHGEPISAPQRPTLAGVNAALVESVYRDLLAGRPVLARISAASFQAPQPQIGSTSPLDLRTVAALLIKLLSSLPECLLTDALYRQFITAANDHAVAGGVYANSFDVSTNPMHPEDAPALTTSATDLTHTHRIATDAAARLPSANRILLARLIALFTSVVLNDYVTQTSIQTLGTLFADAFLPRNWPLPGMPPNTPLPSIAEAVALTNYLFDAADALLQDRSTSATTASTVSASSATKSVMTASRVTQEQKDAKQPQQPPETPTTSTTTPQASQSQGELPPPVRSSSVTSAFSIGSEMSLSPSDLYDAARVVHPQPRPQQVTSATGKPQDQSHLLDVSDLEASAVHPTSNSTLQSPGAIAVAQAQKLLQHQQAMAEMRPHEHSQVHSDRRTSIASTTSSLAVSLVLSASPPKPPVSGPVVNPETGTATVAVQPRPVAVPQPRAVSTASLVRTEDLLDESAATSPDQSQAASEDLSLAILDESEMNTRRHAKSSTASIAERLRMASKGGSKTVGKSGTTLAVTTSSTVSDGLSTTSSAGSGSDRHLPSVRPKAPYQHLQTVPDTTNTTSSTIQPDPAHDVSDSLGVSALLASGIADGTGTHQLPHPISTGVTSQPQVMPQINESRGSQAQRDLELSYNDTADVFDLSTSIAALPPAQQTGAGTIGASQPRPAASAHNQQPNDDDDDDDDSDWDRDDSPNENRKAKPVQPVIGHASYPNPSVTQGGSTAQPQTASHLQKPAAAEKSFLDSSSVWGSFIEPTPGAQNPTQQQSEQQPPEKPQASLSTFGAKSGFVRPAPAPPTQNLSTKHHPSGSVAHAADATDTGSLGGSSDSNAERSGGHSLAAASDGGLEIARRALAAGGRAGVNVRQRQSQQTNQQVQAEYYDDENDDVDQTRAVSTQGGHMNMTQPVDLSTPHKGRMSEDSRKSGRLQAKPGTAGPASRTQAHRLNTSLGVSEADVGVSPVRVAPNLQGRSSHPQKHHEDQGESTTTESSDSNLFSIGLDDTSASKSKAGHPLEPSVRPARRQSIFAALQQATAGVLKDSNAPFEEPLSKHAAITKHSIRRDGIDTSTVSHTSSADPEMQRALISTLQQRVVFAERTAQEAQARESTILAQLRDLQQKLHETEIELNLLKSSQAQDSEAQRQATERAALAYKELQQRNREDAERVSRELAKSREALLRATEDRAAFEQALDNFKSQIEELEKRTISAETNADRYFSRIQAYEQNEQLLREQIRQLMDMLRTQAEESAAQLSELNAKLTEEVKKRTEAEVLREGLLIRSVAQGNAVDNGSGTGTGSLLVGGPAAVQALRAKIRTQMEQHEREEALRKSEQNARERAMQTQTELHTAQSELRKVQAERDRLRRLLDVQQKKNAYLLSALATAEARVNKLESAPRFGFSKERGYRRSASVSEDDYGVNDTGSASTGSEQDESYYEDSQAEDYGDGVRRQSGATVTDGGDDLNASTHSGYATRSTARRDAPSRVPTSNDMSLMSDVTRERAFAALQEDRKETFRMAQKTSQQMREDAESAKLESVVNIQRETLKMVSEPVSRPNAASVPPKQATLSASAGHASTTTTAGGLAASVRPQKLSASVGPGGSSVAQVSGAGAGAIQTTKTSTRN